MQQRIKVLLNKKQYRFFGLERPGLPLAGAKGQPANAESLQ